MFKNAIFYTIYKPIHAEQLLELKPHVLPASLDVSKTGFIPPIDGGAMVETFIANGDHVHLLAIKYSYRDLPSSVVAEAVAEKAKQLSETENRHIGRKERQILKDEVTFSMLPKAFIKHKVTQAIITKDFIIIDSASTKSGEDFTSLLREHLGELRCIPFGVAVNPRVVMTEWVRDQEKCPFEVGLCAELSGNKDSANIRFQNQNMDNDSVKTHINSGLYVNKLALEHEDHSSFILNSDMHLKKFKMSDMLNDKANQEAGEAAEKRDYTIATMIIMTDEFLKLISIFKESFGALDEDTNNGE